MRDTSQARHQETDRNSLQNPARDLSLFLFTDEKAEVQRGDIIYQSHTEI